MLIGSRETVSNQEIQPYKNSASSCKGIRMSSQSDSLINHQFPHTTERQHSQPLVMDFPIPANEQALEKAIRTADQDNGNRRSTKKILKICKICFLSILTVLIVM